MSRNTLKRGAVPPRQKRATASAAARAAARPAATVALPVSAETLRRNIVIGGAALSLVIGLIVAVIMGWPQQLAANAMVASADAGFEIRHVEVSGTREMTRLPVYEAALSGPDNAILTTDLDAIRTRLMALPWVADATVSRRLPDTLAIRITERRPVALWQHRGRFAAIDITGKPLTGKGLERFASLPLVVGKGANGRVREMLVLTAAAPALADRIDAVVLVGERRWNVRFKSGETLALPDTPAAATAAMKRFAAMETKLGENEKLLGGHFERFDMRMPGQMTVAGPAVQQALEAAAKAAREQKSNTI